MTVTKEHLINSVHNYLGMPKNKSVQLVESLLEIIKKTVENSEDVLISGFGKFYVNEKRKRRGRNPATGKNLILDQRRVVTFKCSPVLRDKINKRSLK